MKIHFKYLFNVVLINFLINKSRNRLIKFHYTHVRFNYGIYENICDVVFELFILFIIVSFIVSIIQQIVSEEK